MSISSYDSERIAASQLGVNRIRKLSFTGSIPSRQSGMVQPVVQEMFATVHATGSSLFDLFSSDITSDSTAHLHCERCGRRLVTELVPKIADNCNCNAFVRTAPPSARLPALYSTQR
eukprot:scaffold7374_cov112-Isochrysis_galbana.AAC.10